MKEQNLYFKQIKAYHTTSHYLMPMQTTKAQLTHLQLN